MLESNLSATSLAVSSGQSNAAPKSVDANLTGSPAMVSPAVASSSSVTISSAGRALLASESNASPAAEIDYTVYFAPVRQGYNAWALMAAISNPGAESSSAGKTLAEAATAARASMDEKYQAMKDSGTKFNPNAAYGSDWNSLMGDLDRRSLLAIRENVGGLFSKDEQTQATGLMRQQQGLAMGLYSGPTKFASRFIDTFGNDNLGRMKAAASWLDKVSDDEKQTAEWKQQRTLIDRIIANDGKKPDEEELFDYWAAIREFAEKMRKQGEEHDATMEAMLKTDTPVLLEASGLTSAVLPEMAIDGLTGNAGKADSGAASKRSSNPA